MIHFSVEGVLMDTPAPYVFSIQLEHFHKSLRFHWVICATQNPDRLVSWGHAPTRELAESAVQEEIDDLRSGRTMGGRVRVKGTQMVYRR